MLSIMPNFSIVETIALFGGAYLTKRYLAFIIPIVTLYISDLVINNTIARAYFPDQEGFVFFSDYMIYNVIAMVLIVVIGKTILKKVTTPRLLGSIVLSTLIFFFVTNFGSFLIDPIYPKTFTGLQAAIVAGIPFLKNSLLGNVVYGVAFFGTFELLKLAIPQLSLKVQSL